MVRPAEGGSLSASDGWTDTRDPVEPCASDAPARPPLAGGVPSTRPGGPSPHAAWPGDPAGPGGPWTRGLAPGYGGDVGRGRGGPMLPGRDDVPVGPRDPSCPGLAAARHVAAVATAAAAAPVVRVVVGAVRAAPGGP